MVERVKGRKPPGYDLAYDLIEVDDSGNEAVVSGKTIVERGGPGSGFEGHAGRPGEVGGSLPAGALAEAKKIGGKGGGFLKTLNKIKDSLTPKMQVFENSEDTKLWFDLKQQVNDWEDDASGIVYSFLFRAEHYFPNGKLYKRSTQVVEETDLKALADLKEKIRNDKKVKALDEFMAEVHAITDKHFREATDEEMRSYLGMELDDYEALAALDKWAVYDTIVQKAIEEVITTRRQSDLPDMLKIFNPSLQHARDNPASLAEDMLAPSESMTEFFGDASEEGVRYMPMADTRAFYWLERWFDNKLPRTSNEEVIDEYGGLPVHQVEREGLLIPQDEPPNFPDDQSYFIGVKDGIPVSAMGTTVVDAEKKFDLYMSENPDFISDNFKQIGVDYERDIKGQKYLFVEYLASRVSGQGYGTEMMMKALGMAGENGWGIAGNSTSSAASYYEKLGAKWADTEPHGFDDDLAGMGFWTPDDVSKAYRILKMIGAGKVLESKSFVERGFNVMALADLYDPAALMSKDSDPDERIRRMREMFEKWFDTNHPPEEEVVVVRGLLRRVYVEKGGEGSGHHGHKGREGEVGGSEPGSGGGAGAPKPASVDVREQEIAQTKEEAARPSEDAVAEPEKQETQVQAPENFDVYPAKDANGNRVPFGYVPQDQSFAWNESLETVGQIPFDEKKEFLNGLPKDTREMTADQRWDLAKVMLDLPAAALFEYESRLSENLPNIRDTLNKPGTPENNQARRLSGIRDVVNGAASYLRMMQAGAKSLESDKSQQQALGRNLITTAQRNLEFDVMGVFNWSAEDADAFRSEWAQTLPHNQPAEEKSLIGRGGKGSGFRQHKGRPKEVGGSLPSGEGGGAREEGTGVAADAMAPEIKGVIIQVGEETVQFDGQEQYEQIKALAGGLVEKATQQEAVLTPMLSELASRYGGDMSGMEWKIKSQESMISKIRRIMVEDGLSEDEAAQRVNDHNRYTMLFTPDVYVDKVKSVQKELAASGWQQYDTKWKNYWAGGDDYDGYNTVMTNDAGDRFELQYHTYESIQIKIRSHQIYLKLRSMPEGMKEQKVPLWTEMVGLWDSPYEKPVNFEMLEGVTP